MVKTGQYAIYQTVFGNLKICYNNNIITNLKIVTETEKEGNSRCSTLTDTVFLQLQEYFEGRRKTFDFPYELHGSEFQKIVWMALPP